MCFNPFSIPLKQEDKFIYPFPGIIYSLKNSVLKLQFHILSIKRLSDKHIIQ